MLRILIPSFPCKSRNVERKVISADADVADVLALSTLDHMSEQIEEFFAHAFAVKVVLLNDALTLPPSMQVDEEYIKSYRTQLIDIADSLFAERFEMEDLFSLLKKEGKHLSSDDFENSCRGIENGDPFRTGTLDKELRCNFYEDVYREHRKGNNPLSVKARRKLAEGLASEMDVRHKSFDAFLQQMDLKSYLRLSVLNRKSSASKLSVSLIANQPKKLPWHYSPVMDQNGALTLVEKDPNNYDLSVVQTEDCFRLKYLQKK